MFLLNEVRALGGDLKMVERPANRSKTVLVVDERAATIIKEELEEACFDVLTYSDGLEAFSFLQDMQKRPDLILLNTDLPGMGGFAFCEKLRHEESKGLFGNSPGHIPVVFISAHDTFENRSRSFHLGSLEFISLPFAPGEIAKTVSRMLQPESTFAGMTVLVVDDNKGLRRMVASCLQRIGLLTNEAENGRQAYEFVLDNPNLVDLAIVDFDMPVMRGDEFIHLIRQLPEGVHMPLLTLSSSSGSNIVLHMFRAGATDYLIKPFPSQELLARVKVHLHLRHHLRSLEETNRVLYEKAVSDKLTGLCNKNYFQDIFEELFSRSSRTKTDISCLFFDLDHFKKINDTCGHDFGDYVLKTIGALVKNKIRCGDIAARFGGEEFVIILPNTSLDNAMVVAEKIRSLVAKHPFDYNGQQRSVTISIGVASFLSNKPNSALGLLQQADQALYLAKNSGRNRVYFLS